MEEIKQLKLKEEYKENKSLYKQNNEELQSLKEKKEDNKFIDNYEINNDIIKHIEDKINKEIKSQLNKYFKEYDKKMEEKIKQILSEIKQNNEKIINECINNQKQIMENIDKIKQVLQLNNENKKIDNNNKNNNLNQNLEDNIKNDIIMNFDEKIINKISKKNIDQFINRKNIKDNINNIKKIDYDEIYNDSNNNSKYKKEQQPINEKNRQYIYNLDNSNIEANINEDIQENQIKINENLNINSKNNSNKYFNKPFNANIMNNLKNNNNNNNINILNFNELNEKYQPTNINTNNINKGDNINNKNYDIKKMIPMVDVKKKTKKKKVRKIYQSVNKVFFRDYQQKYIRVQKISEDEKDELERELIKEMKAGEHSLKDYCINYIEENVLPLFKRNDLREEEREIIKYNLEVLLKYCGKDKNTYYNYYIAENNKQKKEIDRKRSIEALTNFRKEFGISEKDYNDEGIINRLIENDYDINKTFQKMFGI